MVVARCPCLVRSDGATLCQWIDGPVAMDGASGSYEQTSSELRSRCDHRRPHISPRRAPVVMWVQISVPPFGSEDQARSTSRAASWAVGGRGSGWGSGGLLACSAGLTAIHCQTNSAVEGTADDPVNLANVESASPPQTCGLQARRQAWQLTGSTGEQVRAPCSSQRCSRLVRA